MSEHYATPSPSDHTTLLAFHSKDRILNSFLSDNPNADVSRNPFPHVSDLTILTVFPKTPHIIPEINRYAKCHDNVLAAPLHSITHDRKLFSLYLKRPLKTNLYFAFNSLPDTTACFPISPWHLRLKSSLSLTKFTLLIASLPQTITNHIKSIYHPQTGQTSNLSPPNSWTSLKPKHPHPDHRWVTLSGLPLHINPQTLALMLDKAQLPVKQDSIIYGTHNGRPAFLLLLHNDYLKNNSNLLRFPKEKSVWEFLIGGQLRPRPGPRPGPSHARAMSIRN